MENEVGIDVKLMRQIEESVKAKRDFCSQILSYISVNAILVVIYFLTTGFTGGYFWPIWCITIWGVVLLTRGLYIHGRFRKTLEEEIQVEYQRIKNKMDTN